MTAFEHCNRIIGVTTGSVECYRLHILAILSRTLNLLLFEKHFLCFVYTNSYARRRRHCTVGGDVPGCVYRAYDYDHAAECFLDSLP